MKTSPIEKTRISRGEDLTEPFNRATDPIVHLDLFSGIGGFAIAAVKVFGDRYRNGGHSEIDRFSCSVYHRHFPDSPCLGEIGQIKWKEGQADVITGGFPCQPHSLAGKQAGSEDERDLWHECERALREIRPRWALFENVPGILVSDGGRFFNGVLSDLARLGYDAEWCVLPALFVGAPHLRRRLWILAYPNGERKQQQAPLRILERIRISSGRCIVADAPDSIGHGMEAQAGIEGSGSADEGDALPNAEGPGLEGRDAERSARPGGFARQLRDALPDSPGIGGGRGDVRRDGIGGDDPQAPEERAGDEGGSPIDDLRQWWQIEPDVGRVADGVPCRVDRLRCLGNAIVPQVAEILFRAIEDHESEGSS